MSDEISVTLLLLSSGRRRICNNITEEFVVFEVFSGVHMITSFLWKFGLGKKKKKKKSDRRFFLRKAMSFRSFFLFFSGPGQNPSSNGWVYLVDMKKLWHSVAAAPRRSSIAPWPAEKNIFLWG